jgi:UDP-2,3-diacylglucosamine pyrophosphatase LpxH
LSTSWDSTVDYNGSLDARALRSCSRRSFIVYLSSGNFDHALGATLQSQLTITQGQTST